MESVTQPGASWNAQLGAVWGAVVLVVQLVPSAQVPAGVQLAGPGVKPAHPACRQGRCGYSIKVLPETVDKAARCW